MHPPVGSTQEEKPQFASFAEFWPFYVGAHKRTICRGLHYAGAVAALATVSYAVAAQQWWFLLLALVAGYGFAWVGHFGCEKNQPATFEYPVYSFVAEFKMFWYGLTGRMRGEVQKYYGDDRGC